MPSMNHSTPSPDVPLSRKMTDCNRIVMASSFLPVAVRICSIGFHSVPSLHVKTGSAAIGFQSMLALCVRYASFPYIDVYVAFASLFLSK